MNARATLCFWLALLSLASLAVSSPVADPEPIDPNLSAVIGSNKNLGCQHGCAAAASAQQLDKNAALGSTASPLSLLAGLVLTGGILASV